MPTCLHQLIILLGIFLRHASKSPNEPKKEIKKEIKIKNSLPKVQEARNTKKENTVNEGKWIK